MQPPGQLDLAERRDLNGVVRTTIELYRGNFWTLIAIGAAVVVPVELIAGAGLNELTRRYQANPSNSTQVIEALISLLVISPLMNAALVQLVLDLGAGRRPDARHALSRSLDVFAAALVAVCLYATAVVVGFFFLILPGIYLLVRWYFATQSVVVDGARGPAALNASGALVDGNWWRTLAVLIVLGLFVLLPGAVLGALADRAAHAADAEGVRLAITTLYECVSLPFLALGAALVFFDLRAARGRPVRGL